MTSDRLVDLAQQCHELVAAEDVEVGLLVGHESGPLAPAVPGVPAAGLPAVQHGLVLAVVVHHAEHEVVLHPHEVLRHVPAAGEHRALELHAASVGVKDVAAGALARVCPREAQRGLQELDQAVRRERVVRDVPVLAGRLPADGGGLLLARHVVDAVGRIREDKVHLLRSRTDAATASASVEDPQSDAVRAELPDVAKLRGRRRVVGVGHVVVRVARRDLGQAVEADAVQVPAAGVELGQHVGQHDVVPLGELGRAVVGERVGAHLLVGPAGRHARDGDLGPAQVAHGDEGAVAGDHLPVLPHDERAPLAELLERALDGLQVAPPVLARVARVERERVDRHDLHLERRRVGLRGLAHGQSSPRVS